MGSFSSFNAECSFQDEGGKTWSFLSESKNLDHNVVAFSCSAENSVILSWLCPTEPGVLFRALYSLFFSANYIKSILKD